MNFVNFSLDKIGHTCIINLLVVLRTIQYWGVEGREGIMINQNKTVVMNLFINFVQYFFLMDPCDLKKKNTSITVEHLIKDLPIAR